ncbi:MAG: type I-MYXAN CRISPR-associated protein Cas5/Cmx5/DevS [Cyanobacteria bacterium P01_F01_bin.143]
MYLLLKAPFAAFRSFQSGSYRSTTPIPSPSTVYGLLLNLAGIEQRTAMDKPITLIKQAKELPKVEIAIASIKPSATAVLSQQLHSYPVGSSGKELAKKTFGAKYWISPVRRQVLIDLELIIGIKAENDFCERIKQGFNGELECNRYGLPFAGDNNFLFEDIQILKTPPMARWYFPIKDDSPPSRGKCRLTTWIDRADNTKTKTEIFAPTDFVLEPPESAWISLPC